MKNDRQIQSSNKKGVIHKYCQISKGNAKNNKANGILRNSERKEPCNKFWVNGFSLNRKKGNKSQILSKCTLVRTIGLAIVYWHYRNLCRQKFLEDTKLYKNA